MALAELLTGNTFIAEYPTDTNLDTRIPLPKPCKRKLPPDSTWKAYLSTGAPEAVAGEDREGAGGTRGEGPRRRREGKSDAAAHVGADRLPARPPPSLLRYPPRSPTLPAPAAPSPSLFPFSRPVSFLFPSCFPFFLFSSFYSKVFFWILHILQSFH